MEHIQLLDCTLRDGGHINKSCFGKKVICSVINYLAESKIDVIEVGFLQNCEFDIERAMYNNISEVRSVIPDKKPGIKYSLMAQADLYDIEQLEDNDGFVDIIRISFHDNHIKEGLMCCRRVLEKGYQCFVNPINLMGYSDYQILKLIDTVNDINPYAFTIVDTFGALMKSDLLRIFYLIDNNLNKKIKIAVHLHENQALSYSLAQDFIAMKSPTRDICIDASLFGMGRVPGNLHIELIMSYMNRTYGTNYDLDPIFDAIDEYIMPIKEKMPWGYATAYALSAHFKVHRTYAEYLINMERLKTKQINQILSMIENGKKSKYDNEYIENLYIKYQSHTIDDRNAIKNLKELFAGKKALLIGPGTSIIHHQADIVKCISARNPVVITANFVWKNINADYEFFTNIKRWNEFINESTKYKSIVTSNIIQVSEDYTYAVNYADYAFYNDKIIDNCMLMLVRLMIRLGVEEIYMAGFDGFGNGVNFALPFMERGTRCEWENERVKEILIDIKNDVKLTFITKSEYEEGD